MPLGVAFWVVWLIWFLFGCYWNRGEIQAGNYVGFGGNFLLAVLLFILGWGSFGLIIHN